MKKTFLWTMVAVGLLFAGSNAYAERKLVLKFWDQQTQGQSVLYLKQAIKAQYPNLRVRDLWLDRVRVVAKSRFGRGVAALKVGPRVTGYQTIYGTPQGFNRNGPRTFDRLVFENPNPGDQSGGAWQILLRGNIKVRKVVLFGGINRNERLVDQFAVYGGYGPTTEFVDVHQGGVKSIILKGAGNRPLMIQNVMVTFGNGRTRALPALRGRLFPGQRMVAQFMAPRGRYVQHIRINAVAHVPMGRALVKVKVGLR